MKFTQRSYLTSMILFNYNNVIQFQQSYQTLTTLSNSNNLKLKKLTSLVRYGFTHVQPQGHSSLVRHGIQVRIWISYHSKIRDCGFAMSNATFFKLTAARSIIALLQQSECQASNHLHWDILISIK